MASKSTVASEDTEVNTAKKNSFKKAWRKFKDNTKDFFYGISQASRPRYNRPTKKPK